MPHPVLPRRATRPILPREDGDAWRIRQVELGGTPLSYRRRRSTRRTVGFMIDASGLSVSAPRRLSEAELERILAGKARWILSKLAQWRERPPPAAPLPWEDGDLVPLLGKPLVLRLDARQSGVRHDALAGVLTVGRARGSALPPDQAVIRRALGVWFRCQAREALGARLAARAAHAGLHYNAFALSSARTRWGSCSSRGAIRLNWRLVHLDETLIDYVVVHELAHLREMNHSARFWQVVQDMMPDYAGHRRALRQLSPASLPDL